MSITSELKFTTNIDSGVTATLLKQDFFTHDQQAHRFSVSCYRHRNREPVDLTGAGVKAYFICADDHTILIDGTVLGNVASVTLPAECYAKKGRFSLIIKASMGDTIATLLWVEGSVSRSRTDVIIDSGKIIPSLDELLAKIDAMEISTDAANQAAETATAAAAAAAETAEAAAAQAVQIATGKGNEAVQIATNQVAAQNQAIARIAADLLTKAPAIECEASGPVVTVTDAAAQPAVQLATHLAPVQEGEGNPSPENVRAIRGWDQVSLTNDTSGQTLSTDLPETVYGGTLDWGTGVLTVNSVVMAFDGTEGDWVVNTSLSSTVRRKPSTDISSVTMCSHYRARSVSVSSNDMSVSSGQYINFRDSIHAVNVDAWTAYLVEQAAAGTPVTIVYALANPYTIQLMPQQLSMLRGVNNLRSGECDTSLVYVADTKLYIDGKFNELNSAILSMGSNV